MSKENNTIDTNLFFDEKIVSLFRKVAMENGTTAEEVLDNFMKDYIVSEGHPEQVVNIWPWSRKG